MSPTKKHPEMILKPDDNLLHPASVLNTKVNVKYCRFSTEMQRVESNADQERRCGDHLERIGIPHERFVVIADEAVSGTRDDRPGFNQLKELIHSGHLGILIVSEQSRLTRGDNAKQLIADIVFHGGRFISVAEGIDTDVKGWQMLVGIHELHHARSNEDTAERVRGAQEGRVLDGNGSAGDFPYGYKSEFADPAAALAYRGRGPKPKKDVFIFEETARVVRLIFERFAGGKSMTSIVQWLNNSPEIPRIGKGQWHHEHIRRLLMNEKFIGRWSFGKTTTLRDSSGKKKQVPRNKHQRVTTVERPSLRIIDAATWQAAQAMLAELKQVYGMKENGKRRGPSEHYLLLYAKRLLNGKILCPHCRSRFIEAGSNKGVRRLGCPNHKAGTCPVATRVPIAQAEAAIINIVRGVLSNYPEWLQLAVQEMRTALQLKLNAIPDERELITRRLRQKESEMQNVVDMVSQGVKTQALRDRIEKLDAEISHLKNREAQLNSLKIKDDDLPDAAWIGQQMRDLATLLTGAGEGGIKPLRSIISDIQAEEILSPGKKRGYMRLRFRLHTWKVLRQALAGRLPDPVLSLLDVNASDDSSAEEFVLDLGTQTPMDKWAPQIAKWRQAKVPWNEIEKRTGLKMANAWLAHKRYMEAGGTAA